MKRLLVAALCFLGCQTTPATTTPAQQPVTQAKANEDPIHLTLIGTNDLHGWVLGQTDRYGDEEIKSGGAAAFAAYLKILREENPGGVLLLDAGDLFQGTLVSNLTEGSAVIDAMNALAYDAAAVGNHEFDYGPVGPVSVATQPNVDPFGALKARIAQAKFPLLSTNIYEAETGHRPSWLPGEGWVIVEKKGVKIGIFGLTTPQTPTVTVPVNVSSLRFGSLAPEALTASRILKEKGADVVIAVVHGGGKCGDWKNPLDTSSCDERTGEVFEMLNGLPPTTVDAVIAGHTHNVIGHFVHGTPVVETFGLGRWFSTIELYVDAKTRSIVGDKTKITPLQPICETVDETSKTCDTRTLKAQGKVKPVPATFHGKKIVAHTEVAKVIEPAIKKVAELQEKQLGLSVPQILGRNYENESPLGDFLADSLKDLEKADVALLNPGGLRADLKPGPVTYGEVYEVLPFDNAIATLQLSADELRRLLNAAYGSRKGVFQVAGLKVTLSRCPTPDRLKNVTLETGKPLEQRTYRVVMPDFLARGGDGLGPVLSTIEPTRVDLGVNREKNLRDALVDHWQKKKESFGQPKPGRVSFLSDDGACSSGTKLDGQTGVP